MLNFSLFPCLVENDKSFEISNQVFSSSFSLQDQFDNLEKHTQWGIEFVEKYTKFVKERSEIEVSYAKQIRWVSEWTYDPYLLIEAL